MTTTAPATAAAPPGQRRVYAVSWVYWNGSEQGGGGFWWYRTLSEALTGFAQEKEGWAGHPARVRLVPVDAPAGLDGQDLTDWLDEDPDALEVDLPALRVGLCGVPGGPESA